MKAEIHCEECNEDVEIVEVFLDVREGSLGLFCVLKCGHIPQRLRLERC